MYCDHVISVDFGTVDNIDSFDWLLLLMYGFSLYLCNCKIYSDKSTENGQGRSATTNAGQSSSSTTTTVAMTTTVSTTISLSTPTTPEPSVTPGTSL